MTEWILPIRLMRQPVPRTPLPLTLTGVGRSPALGSLPAGTEHSQGGMCCPLCPNVGCLASRAVLLAIAPWGGIISDWQMTILRTYVFITISMSYMVSRPVRGEVSRLVIMVGGYRNAWQLLISLVSTPLGYSWAN